MYARILPFYKQYDCVRRMTTIILKWNIYIMTTKTICLLLLGIFSLGVSLLINKNKKRLEETKKKMLDRVKQVKNIETFKTSLDFQHPISSSILTLLENLNVHEELGQKLNKDEINSIENELNFKLPESYKIFLRYFADGGSWVFCQNIDSIQNYSWLRDYRKDLNKTILLNGENINVDSLLCLMSEDYNGGAWCWLTSEEKNNNEWSLAYYSLSDQKLYYKVKNFTEWLKILTKDEYEVIRVLDIDEKLGLG